MSMERELDSTTEGGEAAATNIKTTADEIKATSGKGAVMQFYGCVILFLGLLNTLFSFRSGVALGPFEYILTAAGGAILAAGVLRARAG